MTTLFAFVGTGKYQSVHYELDGRRTSNAEAFTQAALFQLLDPRPDRICVALTTAARRGVATSDQSSFEESNWDKLRQRLQELDVPEQSIVPIDIPNGGTEDELWQIFELLGSIGTGPVIFDATHGFRALPLVATMALPYHGEQAGFRVERLLYGAFEAKQALQPADIVSGFEDVAPFFDLSVMLDIPVWQQAVNDFRYHGRSRGLEERLRRPIADLGRQLGHRAPPELRSLPTYLAKLSDHLSVNKVDDIPPLAEAVVMRLREATSQIESHPATRVLRPLAVVVSTLIEIIEPLTQRPDEQPSQSQLRLARWYADRENYASAFTAMREAVTDSIVEFSLKLGLTEVIAQASDETPVEDDSNAISDSSNKPYGPMSSRYRMKVDGALFQLAKGNVYVDPNNPLMLELFVTALASRPHLRSQLKRVDGMVGLRNKLNHAFKGDSREHGIRRDSRTQRLTLHHDVNNCLEAVEAVIDGLSQPGSWSPTI